MPQIFRLAGALFLVLAAGAAGLGVVLFFVGTAFVAGISPIEGQIGLAAFGIVAVGLYGLARLCGRLADRPSDQAATRRAA
jgi:membrane protein implicated in regulation of membrane protease activity